MKNILTFPVRTEGASVVSPGAGVGNTNGKVHEVIDLSSIRGVYGDRLPAIPRVHHFFTTLREKKVLYVLQQKDGPLLPTDTVCVLSFSPGDEVPDKISISVADFYRYTAADPSAGVPLDQHIMHYAKDHRYVIEFEDEDPDDFDNIEQKQLSEVPNFFPEAIPMSNLSDEDGYDYEIIDPFLDVNVSATSFVRDDSYIPSLLHLLVLAADELESLETEEAAIQIARYGSGNNKSLILVATYPELIDLIDSAIIRGYPLLPAKYDTPASRIRYIHDTIVKKRLHPKNPEGGDTPKGEV